MADQIDSLGLIDGFTTSAWMPDWYLGDPTRVYYPPMTNWILGITTAFTGDIVVAYRLFMFAIVFILGLSIYHIGFSWGHNHFAAIVGAILVMSAPYTLRTLFVEGNFARGLAILPLPYLFWLHERLLTERKIRRIITMLALLWAFAIVAHVQQAVLFAFVIVAYVGLRIVLNEYIPIRRTFFAALALMLGGILASFYIIPAYGKIELDNVPYLPDKIDLFSVDWSAILPTPVTIESITIGVAAIVFALVFCLRFGKQHQIAMVMVASLSVLLAFGEKGGLYLFLPLRQLILPERFLNITAVIIPLLIASSPFEGIRKYWFIIGMVLIIAIDFLPVWRMIHMRPLPDDLTHIAQVSASRSFTGRSVPLIDPSPSSMHIYMTSVIADRDSVTGWALENTPQHEGIRRLGYATTNSLDYLPAVLSLWNTDYIITERETEIASLAGYYDPIVADGDFQLWERLTPSAFAHVLPDNQMLVIGDNASSWMFAFPFASEGFSPILSSYTPEYLSRFTTIGLNRIKNPEMIAPMFGEWVNNGGTLIADFSNLPAPYNAGFDIFGVQTFSYVLDEDSPIQHQFSDFPSTFTLPSDIDRWVGSTYYDLDEVLLSLENDGEIYPVLGYKNVGEGRVWFVGFNLLYWLESQGYWDATQSIVSLILRDENVYQDLVLPSLPLSNKETIDGELSFDYTLDQDQYVILSQTYFPRWKAYLDGQPITIENHQHLIAFDLPAGQHHLELIYEPYSTISMVAFVVSGLGIIAIMGMWIVLRKEAVLTVQDRINDFFDRHSYGYPPIQDELEREICPQCGQKTAIVHPPTKETYPFFSLECPECGFKGL